VGKRTKISGRKTWDIAHRGCSDTRMVREKGERKRREKFLIRGAEERGEEKEKLSEVGGQIVSRGSADLVCCRGNAWSI